MLLKELQTDKTTLYHGDQHPPKNFEGIIKFNYRNIPTHTFIPFHNTVNAMAIKKFNIPIRSCFFCTLSYNKAKSYGEVLKITPVDKYKIFYNKNCIDMTVKYGIASDNIESHIHNISSLDENDEINSYEIYENIIENNVFHELNLEQFGEKFITYLKEQTRNEEIINSYSSYFESLNNSAIDYIDNVEYTENIDDLNNLDQKIEIMLYGKEFKYKKS